MRFSSDVQPEQRYKASSERVSNYTFDLNSSDAADLTLLSQFLGMPRSKILRKFIRQAASAIKLDLEKIKQGGNDGE